MEDKTEIIQQVNIERLTPGKREVVDDVVTREVPLTIILNNKELVTLVCSPANQEFLAAGYLASEGLLDSRDDIRNIRLNVQHNTVHVETVKDISAGRQQVIKGVVTTGSGRGSSFYNFADIKQGIKILSEKKVDAASIYKLAGEFQERSEIFKITGGTHSAALCDTENILLFAEDISRHNAIDKIFGECLLNGIELTDPIIFTSCRIASEILYKIARRHISIIISRAAPTDLAINLANQANITLAGFVRGQNMNIYTNSWRITSNDE